MLLMALSIEEISYFLLKKRFLVSKRYILGTIRANALKDNPLYAFKAKHSQAYHRIQKHLEAYITVIFHHFLMARRIYQEVSGMWNLKVCA